MEVVFWIDKHLSDNTYAESWLKTLSNLNKKYPITKLTYVLSDNTTAYCDKKDDGTPLNFEEIKSDIQQIKRIMSSD